MYNLTMLFLYKVIQHTVEKKLHFTNITIYSVLVSTTFSVSII